MQSSRFAEIRSDFLLPLEVRNSKIIPLVLSNLRSCTTAIRKKGHSYSYSGYFSNVFSLLGIHRVQSVYWQAWKLVDRGIGVPFSAGARNFFPFQSYRLAVGLTEPTIYLIPGALSLGLNQPGRKSDLRRAPSAKVKNKWCDNSIPPYTFMAWC